MKKEVIGNGNWDGTFLMQTVLEGNRVFEFQFTNDDLKILNQMVERAIQAAEDGGFLDEAWEYRRIAIKLQNPLCEVVVDDRD